ncbi:MAG: site-specific integrase [Bacteroidota bacterium]
MAVSLRPSNRCSGSGRPACPTVFYALFRGIPRAGSAASGEETARLGAKTEDFPEAEGTLKPTPPEAEGPAEAVPPGTALRARRDKAILLLGFAAALRRSELAAVRTEHLAFTPDGLRLLIPKSKSDQEGAGQVVGVAYGERPETCPVRAVRSYLAAASRELADQGRPSPLSGAVFRSVGRWGRLGRKAITGKTVANVVKHHAEAAGLDPALYAGHSLRAGFATSAARAGKHDRSIQKQTRHRSARTLAEYVREGRLFDDNASEGIGL